MSKRGTKTQPINVLKLKGTFREDRHVGAALEAKLSHEPPAPPAHLSDDDKKEFTRVANQLAAVGLCTELDVEAVELFVVTSRGVREVREELESEGCVVETTKGGTQMNPLARILDQRIATLKWCLSQFGMTPSARSSLHLADKKKAEDDEEAVSKACGF